MTPNSPDYACGCLAALSFTAAGLLVVIVVLVVVLVTP